MLVGSHAAAGALTSGNDATHGCARPNFTPGAHPMTTSFTRRVLNTDSRWSPTILRVIPGIVFAVHGSQKLFGWFGGYGLAGTGQWMESVGFTPGYVAALLAGSAEFFGG